MMNQKMKNLVMILLAILMMVVSFYLLFGGKAPPLRQGEEMLFRDKTEAEKRLVPQQIDRALFSK